MIQLIVALYLDAECQTQGGLFAGIIAIESRLRNIGNSNSRDASRLQIVINICKGDAVIRQRIAYLRRCIHASEQSIYLRTNDREGYYVFSPSPRSIMHGHSGKRT